MLAVNTVLSGPNQKFLGIKGSKLFSIAWINCSLPFSVLKLKVGSIAKALNNLSIPFVSNSNKLRISNILELLLNVISGLPIPIVASCKPTISLVSWLIANAEACLTKPFTAPS